MSVYVHVCVHVYVRVYIRVCSCVCEELKFQISSACCSVHHRHPAILVNYTVTWCCMVFEFKGETVQIFCPNCKFSLERQCSSN